MSVRNNRFLLADSIPYSGLQVLLHNNACSYRRDDNSATIHTQTGQNFIQHVQKF